MADKGTDPIPIFKKVLNSVKKIKKFKYFGQVRGKHIIILKPNN